MRGFALQLLQTVNVFVNVSELEVMNKTYFVKLANHFLSAIKRTEGIFGHLLLVYLSLTVLGLILSVFVTLTIFIDDNVFEDLNLLLVVLGSSGNCMVSMALTAFTPEMVHFLEARVGSLILKLDHITNEGPAEKMIYIDKEKPKTFFSLKKIISSQLKRFQGIKVLDYFTIKRSLLTSIFAHFVTYIIVLLQFKVSENGAASRNNFHNVTSSILMPN